MSAGLTESEAAARRAARGAPPETACEPLDRDDRPGEHDHALQRDPARARAPDAGLRRLARRALPRDPRHEHGHRDLAGAPGAREARRVSPRSSRRARPSSATERQRPRARLAARRGRSRAARARRPGRRRRAAHGGDRAPARRVDPDRRVPSRRARRRAKRSGRARSCSREPARSRSRAVGAESYAERITGTAREFRHPRSPLERAIDRLLYVLLARDDPARRDADRRAREAGRRAPPRRRHGRRRDGDAHPGGPDPARLGHVRGGRAPHGPARGALAAAERDRVARLRRHDLHRQDRHADGPGAPRRRARAGGRGPRRRAGGRASARFAASLRSRNATLAAIAAAYPRAAEPGEELVPFASRRRWSGVRLGGVRYVLGAPELFPLGPLDDLRPTHAEARAAGSSRSGRRTARSPRTDTAAARSARSASWCSARSSGRTRARRSAFLGEQDVELVVLSGDAPDTVGSIASDAGIAVAAPPSRRRATCRRATWSSTPSRRRSPSSGGSRPRASGAWSSRCAATAATWR